MEIVSFDIIGKFAHFRKFYSNSTALSFSIPPRTSLMGLISAFMGYEKDTYYDKLSSEKIRIGVFVKTPIRKQFQRVNHLKVENQSDFRGKSGHTQTPFEFIIPENIITGDIIYTIYLSCFEEGKEEFEKIKFALNNKYFGKFNLSFGTANFMCHLINVNFYDNDKVNEKYADGEFIKFNSAIISEDIFEIKFARYESLDYNIIEEEMMPADFVGNQNREVKDMVRILYSLSGIPIEAKIRGNYYEIKDEKDNILNIQFLEKA